MLQLILHSIWSIENSKPPMIEIMIHSELNSYFYHRLFWHYYGIMNSPSWKYEIGLNAFSWSKSACSRFSGHFQSIWNPSPFFLNYSWWAKQAKQKPSPVIICLHWVSIDFSTYSIGSIVITRKISSIGFQLLLVSFKRFSTVISSISTSPKVCSVFFWSMKILMKNFVRLVLKGKKLLLPA